MLVVIMASALGQDVPTISLEAAIARAEAQGTNVRVASATLEGARARTAGAMAGLLPIVQAEGSVQRWDRAAEFSFAEGGTFDCAAIPPPFDVLCTSLGEPTVVREQTTLQGTVRAIQPLTGLVAGAEQHRSARNGVRAAEAGEAHAQAQARFAAADAWYAALETEAQVEVADAQVRTLQERERSVSAAVAAKAAVKNDLLQIQLALSRARQGQLAVAAFRDASYRQLSVTLGDHGTPLRPDGAVSEPTAEALDAEDALLQRAIASRKDLSALVSQREAAKASVQALSLQRLPQLSAVGSVTHQEGQSLGVPPNSAFVGLNLDWTVFAFDRQGAAVRSLRANVATLDAHHDALMAGVRVEVATRRQALITARTSWGVAREAVTLAEENVALFKIRYDSGAATTFELLEAESQLVEARSAELAGRYGVLRSEAALALAVGG